VLDGAAGPAARGGRPVEAGVEAGRAAVVVEGDRPDALADDAAGPVTWTLPTPFGYISMPRSNWRPAIRSGPLTPDSSVASVLSCPSICLAAAVAGR